MTNHSKPRPGMRRNRARLPFCWVCSRKLQRGGWQYVTVKGEDKRPHDVHGACVGSYEVLASLETELAETEAGPPPQVRCGTFGGVDIPPHIRKRMGEDRAKAEREMGS